MKAEYRHLKNSNTGELILEQKFTECKTNFPTAYYRHDGIAHIHVKCEYIHDGFVEISEKKYNRLIKKQKRKNEIGL